MKVSAKLKNLRVAPRKSRLLIGLIKGLDIKDALIQLDDTGKKSSIPLKKLLESAIANGENNFGLDKNNLYVFDVKIQSGPVLKRWMPKAFGRAGRILKRTSVIEIILEERVEGKGRKTKEEIAKEKQQKAEERKKQEKERDDRKKQEEKVSEKGINKKAENNQLATNQKKEKSGWGSKIFRRKSM